MNAADSINELARIEEELEYQLVGARQRISGLKTRSRPEEWPCDGDNTPLTEGGDARQATEERESESEQMVRLVEHAAGLEHALSRIQNGTYGRCECCDRLIDPKRLRVLPEALYCLNCTERLESSL